MVSKYGNWRHVFVSFYLYGALLILGGCGERNAMADIPKMEHDINAVMAEIGIKPRHFDFKIAKREAALLSIDFTDVPTIQEIDARVRKAAINNGYDRISAVRLENGSPIVNFCHHTMPNLYITWLVRDNKYANLSISSEAFKIAYAPCSVIYSKSVAPLPK